MTIPTHVHHALSETVVKPHLSPDNGAVFASMKRELAKLLAV